MTGEDDEQFEEWRRHFIETMGKWLQLIPSGIVGAGGAIYFVRLPDRRASADGTRQSGQLTESEWEDLGWTFRDGVRSAHPHSKADSDLGRASLALAEVCESFRPELLRSDAGAAKRLEHALTIARELLKESPDPVTKVHKEAAGDVELVASEIAMQRAQIRHQIAQEERLRREEEEREWRIAEKIRRLNAAEEERPTTALEDVTAGIEQSNKVGTDQVILWILAAENRLLYHQDIEDISGAKWAWLSGPIKKKTVANHFSKSGFLKRFTSRGPGGRGRQLNDQGRDWVSKNPPPESPET